MKALFWVGLAAIVLGIVLLFVPLTRHDRQEVKAGPVEFGYTTKHSETLSPVVAALIILAGAGVMIAARAR